MPNLIRTINDEYATHLSVDFAIFNVCNFHCHYCHPGSNEGDSRFPKDYDLVVRNFDHLLNIYRTQFNKTNIKIEMTGGEPTVWPKLQDFAKHIKENHQVNNLALTTNGSRTMRWWRENGKYFDEVHLSLHPEEGSAEHLINVADFMYNETNGHVAINVIMDPTNWDKCKENLDKVVNHPVPWLVKSWLLVKEGYLRTDYNKEQLDLFRDKVQKSPPQEYINDMIARNIIPAKSSATFEYDDGSIEPYNSFSLREKGTHNFYGWQCNLGIDRVPIIFGNIVGSCGANNMFNRDTPLSIYDEDFISKFTPDIIKPIICNQLSCGGCTKDLKLPKHKITDSKVFTIKNI